MSSSAGAVEAVSQRLNNFLARQRAQAKELGDEAAIIIDAADDALTGGKRLRGRFLIAGWRAVNEAQSRASEPPSPVIGAAAALEVFHAAALVHDDVIDNSDTRRGRPSAHRALETRHRSLGWRGDAAAFGRSGAILLGDLLVAWSDDLFEESLAELDRAEDAAAATAREEYARMRREVTVGQFLDIAEESAFRVAPDEEHADRALRVASFKSARYSIQQPLVIGAALAGGADDQRAALAAFGHPLGMAFQLRDDVLGVFGDSAETGKPAGDDLREGKRTVLIAYAREAIGASARRIVDELIGDPDLDDEQIGSLQRTIIDSGALARVETLIEEYSREAARALSGADLGHGAVNDLRELARAATVRVA
ncbi:polyprenyl synthetase family protein [Microbacterium invictum]|uniref:Polyprenyl synthetase family protein n=1 Tax=Microbacterium invictum TaxID=515415 RepID=A0ABZ0V8N1_9MICO|nr:polyprenyl synthetase family protein [Microbacterium invictum]WQB69198.1 polyprenyl synthetase family protein [Microbacterium invictum]